MNRTVIHYERLRGHEQDAVFLFGHCEASARVIDYLFDTGVRAAGILDNNPAKYGLDYRGVPVVPPETVLSRPPARCAVAIASRFYEAMASQLRGLGYTGGIVKLADYNTYADYSLSPETIARKLDRVRHGETVLSALEARFPGAFRVFCPLAALGDVYLCMSYLPHFLRTRGEEQAVVCVPSRACGETARLFGAERVEVLPQEELDAAIQAAVYTHDARSFIAHQDRPYLVHLHRALYVKKIPLDLIYRCGVFGLPRDTEPVRPRCWKPYSGPVKFRAGETAVLAPHAKSVLPLPAELWTAIAADCRRRGLQVLTNTAGDEPPIPGTEAVSPPLNEMKSLVEQAGLFVGIRSGLCDVIRTADCRKIALYPDYYYSDTRWKAVEMYALPEFENVTADGGFSWESLW